MDLTPQQQMMSSGAGALAVSLLMTPLDVVKIRLQSQERLFAKKCFLYNNGRSHHPCQAPRSEGDPRCNLTGVGAALGFVDPGAELLVHGEVGDCGGYGQDKGGTQTGPKTWKSLRFGDLHKGVGGGVEVLGAVEPLAVADLLRGV